MLVMFLRVNILILSLKRESYIKAMYFCDLDTRNSNCGFSS